MASNKTGWLMPAVVGIAIVVAIGAMLLPMVAPSLVRAFWPDTDLAPPTASLADPVDASPVPPAIANMPADESTPEPFAAPNADALTGAAPPQADVPNTTVELTNGDVDDVRRLEIAIAELRMRVRDLESPMEPAGAIPPSVAPSPAATSASPARSRPAPPIRPGFQLLSVRRWEGAFQAFVNVHGRTELVDTTVPLDGWRLETADVDQQRASFVDTDGHRVDLSAPKD